MENNKNVDIIEIQDNNKKVCTGNFIILQCETCGDIKSKTHDI